MSTPAFELMDHQKEGVEFLTKRRFGLLAFEQGLGKTLVAIESFRKVKDENKAERLLIICPNSLKRNWCAEIAKFAPELEITIAEGAPQQRRELFANASTSVVITSYETARSEITAVLAYLTRRPTALVLDESHAAKTWRSLTSTAVRHFAPHCIYRWLLSGTPVTNSPLDLYTQIEIITAGNHKLGSKDSFLINAATNPESTRESIGGFIFRRTKEQCLDLPEKIFVDTMVDLPDWQRKLYNAMRDEMVCSLQEMSGEEYKKFASTALAKLTRLIQLASNPALVFPDLKDTPGKIEALDGVVEDILSVPERKVIIWSNYVATIEMLIDRYKAYGVVALYGGIATENRQEMAAKFQNDKDTRVLIANPAAAGTGFTLTSSNFSIYETLSWRYDFYAQSQDRNHRIGQSLPVTYTRLIAVDTIEEVIVKALQRKSMMASGLLGDDQSAQSLSNLTRDEMCHMLVYNEMPSEGSHQNG